MGGVLAEPIEPKIDRDEEGENGNRLAEGEPKPLPEPFPDAVERMEVIEKSETSRVKLITNGVMVVVPNKVPAIPRSSNNTEEPDVHSLHEVNGTQENTEEVSQVSSDDGVGVLKGRSKQSVRTIAETVRVASWLIDVKLLFVCTL